MIERSSTPGPIGAMFDRRCEHLDSRSEVLRVDAPGCDVDETVRRVEGLLAEAVVGAT